MSQQEGGLLQQQQQQGGVRYAARGPNKNAVQILSEVPGSEQVLSNGAVGAKFNAITSDGKRTVVFRIVGSTPEAARQARRARSKPRKITLEEAQKAYDKYYYGKGPIPTYRRGERKGEPRFASQRGRHAAGTYDRKHTNPKRIVDDARYLSNPHYYEFRGVDTGNVQRAPASRAQLAARAKGWRTIEAKRKAADAAKSPYGRRSPVAAARSFRRPPASRSRSPVNQYGGYWW